MQLPVRVRRLAYRVAYRVLAIYWFVRRPPAQGVKCVLTHGDHVLLVRHTYGRRDWELPGGSIKRDESPLSAARREMHEELGLSIDGWVALGRVFTTVYNRRDTLHCFQAELPAPQITIDRGEIVVARWFPRRELPEDTGRLVAPILARAQ